MNVASRPRLVGEFIPFPSSKVTSFAVSLTVSKSNKNNFFFGCQKYYRNVSNTAPVGYVNLQ